MVSKGKRLYFVLNIVLNVICGAKHEFDARVAAGDSPSLAAASQREPYAHTPKQDAA
jgi:hypothetical protein